MNTHLNCTVTISSDLVLKLSYCLRMIQGLCFDKKKFLVNILLEKVILN